MCRITAITIFVILAVNVLAAMAVTDNCPGASFKKAYGNDSLESDDEKKADDKKLSDDEKFEKALDEILENLDEKMEQDPAKILDPVLKYGDAIKPRARKSLESDDEDEQIIAAAMLMKLGDKSGLSILLEALREDEETAVFLAAIGGREMTDILIKELRGDNATARSGALIALGMMRAPEALPEIERILEEKIAEDIDEEKADLKAIASIMLVKLGKPAIPLMTKILSGSDSELAYSVLESIDVSFAGSIESLEALLAAIIASLDKQKDADLLDDMIVFLEDITEQEFGKDAAKWQNWWMKNRVVFMKDIEAKIKKSISDGEFDEE